MLDDDERPFGVARLPLAVRRHRRVHVFSIAASSWLALQHSIGVAPLAVRRSGVYLTVPHPD